MANEFIRLSRYLSLGTPNMKSVSIMQFRMPHTSAIYVLQITPRHTRIGRTCTHVPSIDCTGRITRNNDGVHGDIRVTLISALRQTDDARCVKCYWFTLQAEWVSIFDFRVGTVVPFSIGFDPASSSNLNTRFTVNYRFLI